MTRPLLPGGRKRSGIAASVRLVSASLLLLRAFLPGPAAAQLLYIDDLEKEDPDCWTLRKAAGCNGWNSIRDAGINLAEGAVAASGRKSLKITFTRNEDYAGATRIVDSRHIFTRFYDYYDEGFDFAAGMKIHRLSSYNAARQLNDFDIILYSQAAGGPDYCGVSDMQYLNLTYNGGPVDWGVVGGVLRMERKRWYSIETEVKLNTPGKSDGLVRIWVDGKLFAEKLGMNLTANVSSPINRVLFGGWYSNSSAGRNPCPDPAKPSVRYVDNAAISSSYIGTVPTITLGPARGSRIISWIMPEGGASSIEYGPSSALGSATPPSAQPQGLHSVMLTGLDTNRTYHYRVRCARNSGGNYLSPGYTFTTSPGGAAAPPRKSRPPVNLKSHQYDPIPD